MVLEAAGVYDADVRDRRGADFCAVPMMESRDGTGQKEGIFGRGDGQRNRRLGAFSFRLLNRSSEKSADCAQECAQTCVP